MIIDSTRLYPLDGTAEKGIYVHWLECRGKALPSFVVGICRGKKESNVHLTTKPFILPCICTNLSYDHNNLCTLTQLTHQYQVTFYLFSISLLLFFFFFFFNLCLPNWPFLCPLIYNYCAAISFILISQFYDLSAIFSVSDWSTWLFVVNPDDNFFFFWLIIVKLVYRVIFVLLIWGSDYVIWDRYFVNHPLSCWCQHGRDVGIILVGVFLYQKWVIFLLYLISSR